MDMWEPYFDSTMTYLPDAAKKIGKRLLETVLHKPPLFTMIKESSFPS